MIATESPRHHGELDANNLGLHQADLPPTTFTMPPAVLFEGLLDGESSTVEQLNQALTPAAGSATPNEVVPNNTTPLGRNLENWFSGGIDLSKPASKFRFRAFDL